jgi:hypothetical protein
MSRNSLLLIVIIVVIAGAAFAYYQHRQNTLLEVGVGGHTLKIPLKSQTGPKTFAKRG